MPVNTTIKIRKGTASEWNSSNPVLASGEPGYEIDTNRFKIGNGNSNWNSLSYSAIVPSGFTANSGIDLSLGPNGSSLNIGISGSFVASTGYFDVLSFNTNIEPVLSQGQIAWNDTEGTVDIALTDTVVINIGEHEMYRVRNATSDVLYKGQAVMASGVHANGIIIPNLYTANGSVREIRFMGLVYENINNNNNGYVIHFGHINNIDTRGNVVSNIAVGDETWNDGDILYVHPTVAGKLTKVEPKHSIAAAIILDAASNGKIFVRPISYGHLGDNHDVSISGATNGQFLQYNSATDYWVPSSSGNFTTLLVNGTGVSVSGHTHLVNDITNFASGVADEVSTTITPGTGINLNYDSGTDILTVSVTGLISNAANNRILTSRDNTTTGIDAESNLTFDGNTFVCSGNARIGDVQYIDVNNGNIYIKNPDGSLVADFEERSLFGDSNIKSIEFGSRSLVDSSGTSTLYWYTPSRIGILNDTPSYTLDVIGTGNFSQNLLVNGTGVSLNGHSHVVTDITDFSTGVADEVNTTLTAGSGIVLDYDSGTDTLTIHTSGVRNKSLTYFTSLDNQPPATNFATLDTRNSIAVLDFDDTTEESAVFVGILPENASLGSGISVRIHWMATSATTGSCRWGVQFEKMNTDLDSDSFNTATEAHSTTNGTAGIITTTSITCTSIDSLAAGDLFRIKIYRDVSDTTNDTMTGDAELVAVELRSIL